MINVIVGNRIGKTTSVIPHSTGKYPIWFEDSKRVEFVDAYKVIFESFDIKPISSELSQITGKVINIISDRAVIIIKTSGIPKEYLCK